MPRRLLVGAVLAILSYPSFAAAQLTSEGPMFVTSPAVVSALTQPSRVAEEQFAGQAQVSRPAVERRGLRVAPVAWKSVMTSLYATTAAMQLLDVDSTLKSLNRGAIEVNPLMGGLVGHRAVFLATKAGVAAAAIYSAHKIAKNNRVAAALTLVAINSAYAMAVRTNYGIARR